MTYLLEEIAPEIKPQISELRKSCESISRQLYGWMESLKDTEIQGQRRLDDKERTRLKLEKERAEFFEELRGEHPGSKKS
jgi:hypothetical protein